ncbi:hypothetical protein PRIPAC_81587 [Pristionchus pacificus]|nr:hypothetical protein PRIPAC_81587 [Pristionchus pacificus]
MRALSIAYPVSMFPVDKVCRVCSAPNNSIHFGVDVCRACSSFFKRAVLSGKQLSCRQVSRNCEITKDDKFTCRGCRFDKCLAAGMVYDGPLRRSSKNMEEVGASRGECLDRPTDPLLLRIRRKYEINVANRRRKELELLRTCSTSKLLPHPTFVCWINLSKKLSSNIKNFTQEIYTGTADLVMRTMDFTIDETWKFIHKIHPLLCEIPFQEQLDLFRNYVVKFSLIEQLLHTWKVWGAYQKFLMCSIAQCVNLDEPDSWIGQDEGGSNRKSLIDSSLLYVRDQMTVIVPLLKKSQLTDEEEHALFALMLCESDMKEDASERLLSLLDSIRAEILVDLQRYYREELGLNDFSTRLGNLLTICHNVRECSVNFQSFFRMQVALFDIWSADAHLKHLLL